MKNLRNIFRRTTICNPLIRRRTFAYQGVKMLVFRKILRTHLMDGFLWDALRDLVPFVQFEKRKKHPWKSVTFITDSSTSSWVLLTFLKLCKSAHTTDFVKAYNLGIRQSTMMEHWSATKWTSCFNKKILPMVSTEFCWKFQESETNFLLIFLRILSGKKHRQINLQCLEKVRI